MATDNRAGGQVFATERHTGTEVGAICVRSSFGICDELPALIGSQAGM